MSTRSSIRIRERGLTDGASVSIYCHWDGYIAYNGVVLQLYYNTPEKVEELLKLGNLSKLGFYTQPKGEHSFENPEEDCCVAYHRDRGEEFSQNGGKQEFNYIYDKADRCWYVEIEEFTMGTLAEKSLGINGYDGYRTALLLDEIYSHKDEIEQMWKDENPDVIKDCTNKAIEARQEIINRQHEEYNAYYNAYCL